VPIDDAVTVQLDGPVGRITLNRPARLNAMDQSWIDALNVAVERVAAAPEIRAVLIRGAGRAFCAGLDLDMLADVGMPAGFYEGQERAFRALEDLDVVTIAAIHGHCLGGGVQLAVACDIRVCSSDAVLGLSAIKLGLFPGLAPMRLPRLVGLATATRLILGGENIDAEEALRIHLADYVVPAAEFEARVEQILRTYLAASRPAIKGAKQLLRAAFGATWDEAFAQSLPLLQECLASDDVARTRAARRPRRVD
jgi:enoyl-CoA hydratase/carnithine racemase